MTFYPLGLLDSIVIRQPINQLRHLRLPVFVGVEDIDFLAVVRVVDIRFAAALAAVAAALAALDAAHHMACHTTVARAQAQACPLFEEKMKEADTLLLTYAGLVRGYQKVNATTAIYSSMY